MPIIFRSKLSSTVANATFLDKTIDDLKKGKLGLFKIDTSEATAIQDVQQYISEIVDTVGVNGEGDTARKEYSSNNYIANGDNRKVAIGKLDTEMLNVNNRVTAVEDDIEEVQTVEKEPTGFPSRDTTTISFDDLTRTFTIAPTGASFDIFVKGQKFTKTSESVVIDDVSGNQFVYYTADGTLTSSVSFDLSLFENNALVSIIYWNATEQSHSYFADERHGLTMDGATHSYLHTVFGARYISGYALQNFSVDGDGSLDAHAQFDADSGSIRDEDILIQSPIQSQIPILFREGTLWRKKAADAFPVIYNGTADYTETLIPYNELVAGSWQLTELTDNAFVLVHVFATNDIETPVVGILGINTYNNIPEARAAADSEISSLEGLPFAEFVAVGTVIFEAKSGYTNTPKARIVSPEAGAEYVDFRGEQLYTPSGVATSHSLLSNLSSDDHPQYFNEARGDARYVRDAVNLGAGEGIYSSKLSSNLQLKSLIAGDNVTLASDANTITINSSGGGGGGGSLSWEKIGDLSPSLDSVDGFKLEAFSHLDEQEIYLNVNVPESYSAGSQIKLKSGAFFTNAINDNVRFRTETTLVRPGSLVLGTYANIHLSTNTEVTLSATANLLTAIGDLDLTDAAGEINGVAVAPGDKLRVKLFRFVAGETVSAQEDARLLINNFDISFSG